MLKCAELYFCRRSRCTRGDLIDEDIEIEIVIEIARIETHRRLRRMRDDTVGSDHRIEATIAVATIVNVRCREVVAN